MTETLQKTENVAENIANEKMQLLEQVSAFELRDQLQIKDIRISKLKEKNAELIELLKDARVYVFMDTQEYEDNSNPKYWREQAKKILTKIDEVLKCGNVL